jgi:ABC-type multidrug transport system fused ATPase/permease subunit
MTRHSVYRLYGLAIESAIALPLPLAGNQDGTDLQLLYPGPSSNRLPASERGGRELAIDDRGWELRFHRMTGDWVSFRYCRASRQLVVTGTDAWDEIIPILLGAAAGVLLRDRGICVFHGSTVAHHGRAVAVLGPSGAGKSTLAGALMARGSSPMT